MAFQDAGIEIHGRSELADIFKSFNRDQNELVELDERETDIEFPMWIRPLAGKLPVTPRNDSLVYVFIRSDEQLKLVCDSANELSKLQMLGLDGISPNGLRYLEKHIGDFVKLDAFFFVNCLLEDDGLKNLTQCRQLFIQIHGTGVVPNPTHSQLIEIASLPKLELLMLNLVDRPVEDSDLEHLSACRSLKEFHIYGISVSPSAVEAFRKSHPDCNVVVTK